MQAINHVATALILKRKFPAAPLLGLIIATEVMEYLWVALNLLGIEQTVIGPEMRSVADVHLVHMPFSHSVATTILVAVIAGLCVWWRGGTTARVVGFAIALGVASHMALDLVVHAHDIPFAPFMDGPKIGTGLYANVPLIALVVETVWGLWCWWMYRGSWALLAVIVVAGAGSIPFYSVALNTGEGALAGQSTAFALIILVQMLVTSALVWWLAREPAEA